MSRFILLHGLFGTGDNFWFPWLASELAAAGHTVQRPDLPDADKPDMATWTAFLLQHTIIDADTVLVGHSAGSMLVLSALQQLTQPPVRRAILVAGFIDGLPNVPDDNAVYLHNPDWNAIKRNGHDFCFINSDDDPWGCDHRQGQRLRAKLGGTLVACTGQGHFGSQVFAQPYAEFPLLKALCLLP